MGILFKLSEDGNDECSFVPKGEIRINFYFVNFAMAFGIRSEISFVSRLF